MSAGPPAEASVLSVKNLAKSFNGTPALDGISLTLEKGEIHALLGGNGSGKSTFIKALAGVQPADEGTFTLRGQTINATSMTPAQARDGGVHFVHQQLAIFPALTVAENLAIEDGFGRSSFGMVRWRKVRAEAEDTLARFHIAADPGALLADLSQANQVMVAIARMLKSQTPESNAILVLDEPTAALPAVEVDELLESLKRCARSGQAILYVTHRLEEVVRIADAATVFRDGKVTANLTRSQITHKALVECIMGRKAIAELSASKHAVSKTVVAKIDGLRGGSIHDATFEVRSGEILGIAGVLGSGRSSLLRMLFGDLPVPQGRVEINGKRVRFNGPRDAMAAGVAMVPEDRATDAVFPGMTVTENLGICTSGAYYRAGLFRHRRERADARALQRDYLIKAASETIPISTLSGGNQQKVILARWMRRNPALLLLDEPTQGVDVGARSEIWHLVRTATEGGAGALVVSSDFEELARVCDRVLVLRGHRLTDELIGEHLTEQRITQLTLNLERAS